MHPCVVVHEGNPRAAGHLLQAVERLLHQRNKYVTDGNSISLRCSLLGTRGRHPSSARARRLTQGQDTSRNSSYRLRRLPECSALERPDLVPIEPDHPRGQIVERHRNRAVAVAGQVFDTVLHQRHESGQLVRCCPCSCVENRHDPLTESERIVACCAHVVAVFPIAFRAAGSKAMRGPVMGKLVRDLIPKIIEAEGRAAQTRVLDDSEYEAALFDKLLEEVEELRAASTDKLLEEAADVYEVLIAILGHGGLTQDDMFTAATAKRLSRGGFEKRAWLESW